MAAASQWPLPSVGHAWSAADAAACFNENQNLIAITKAFDTDTIDTNPLYVTGPSIAAARARFAPALAAFVDGMKEAIKSTKYHIGAQMDQVIASEAALVPRFKSPMTEDEYKHAWAEAESLKEQWLVWVSDICIRIEKAVGTPPPPRY